MSGEVNLDEAVKKYREIALAEMRGEKGPRPKVSSYTTLDFLNPARPTLSRFNAEDSKYVVNFRLVRYSELEKIVGLSAANTLWYNAGKSLGELAVSKGLIKNVDDLIKFVVEQRIGLVDVLSESSNKARIHVYECISCAGIPNIGRPVCYFEGGLIAGVLGKLMNRRARAIETHCWGSGYSFCGFDVVFE